MNLSLTRTGSSLVSILIEDFGNPEGLTDKDLRDCLLRTLSKLGVQAMVANFLEI